MSDRRETSLRDTTYTPRKSWSARKRGRSVARNAISLKAKHRFAPRSMHHSTSKNTEFTVLRFSLHCNNMSERNWRLNREL
jgi:hypothetical protein